MNVVYVRDDVVSRGGYGSIQETSVLSSRGGICNDYVTKRIHISEASVLELAIMRSLRCPYLNNAELICSGVDDYVYIIQKRAQSDMRTHCFSSKVSREVIRDWFLQISLALRELHRRNIIHGDIKASNILLMHDNRAVLCDFGLSVIESYHIIDRAVGTITHQPPEILEGRGWNRSVDMWALGCTFYEMLYGECLFPCSRNKSNHDQVDNITTRLKAYRQRAHSREDAIILSLLTLQSRDRPSIDNLINSLTQGKDADVDCLEVMPKELALSSEQQAILSQVMKPFPEDLLEDASIIASRINHIRSEKSGWLRSEKSGWQSLCEYVCQITVHLHGRNERGDVLTRECMEHLHSIGYWVLCFR